MVRVGRLNSEGDPVGEYKEFATVEQAQKWAEDQRAAPLEWDEDGRFFALEGMTKEEGQHLSDTAEYPPIRFMIVGVETDGTDRELEDEDFEATKLVAWAMLFYQGAEAPDANEHDVLFTALVEHDVEAIRRLLEAHNIEVK